MEDSNSQADTLSGEMEGAALERNELVDVLILLARRRGFIFRVTMLAVIGGIVISFLLPVRYTAMVEILTPQQVQSVAPLLLMNSGSSSNLSALAASSTGAFSMRSPNDIYVGLLESRLIADGIIREFDLTKVYHSRDMTAARKKLAKRTIVTSEKSGLLSIAVIDSDKARAAAIANAYVDQLHTLTKTLAVSEASQRRLYYEDQLDHAKESLVSAESAFRQIQRKQGIVQLDAQARAAIGSLAALRAQIDAKQVELQALRSFSTEANPSVQLLEAQVGALQTEASKLEQKSGLPSSDGLGLQDVAGAGIDYLRAEHELLYRQTLFDMLLKQYDAAKLDEAKQGTVIQVVEPAIPPDRMSFPIRSIVVLVFLFIGFLSACIYVYARETIYSNPALLQPLRDIAAALKGKSARFC
jgi:capsule polysaccharide export protein KpsE/RkpR